MWTSWNPWTATALMALLISTGRFLLRRKHAKQMGQRLPWFRESLRFVAVLVLVFTAGMCTACSGNYQCLVCGKREWRATSFGVVPVAWGDSTPEHAIDYQRWLAAHVLPKHSHEREPVGCHAFGLIGLTGCHSMPYYGASFFDGLPKLPDQALARQIAGRWAAAPLELRKQLSGRGAGHHGCPNGPNPPWDFNPRLEPAEAFTVNLAQWLECVQPEWKEMVGPVAPL